MKRMVGAMLGLLALLAALAPARDAAAEEAWPSKPVRLIVPSSPGGGTDVFARILAQALSEGVKQSFIVENRPGASGNIGAQAAAAAAPDGYTFLVSSNNSTAINQFLYKTASFNVERDLVPVARGVFAINTLLVTPSLEAGDVGGLVALAKARPGTLAYGTAGTGSSPYLGVRMIAEMAGIDVVHVPYKGLGPAYQDLVGGRIQFMYADLASALSYVNAGRMRVLAVDRRTPLLPGAPTFAEAGWSSFDAPTSFSVMAPSQVPPTILDRMAASVAQALRAATPRLEAQALLPVFDTPTEFAESLARERAMWGDFIRRNNITADQ